MDTAPTAPFGALLRRYRVAAGLSQDALAERADLSAAAVSALERGVRRAPYRHTVDQLSEALALAAPERVRLHAAVSRSRTETLPDHAAPVAAGLPAPATSFVGREQEQTIVLRLLESSRLLTLVGMGGIGKTRLATRVASGPAGTHPDGVRLVELASLADPALLALTVARSLEVRDQPGMAVAATLVGALTDKELLLVLDNCEHLRDAAGELVAILLHACPKLRILITSREALGVTGEMVWVVPSLTIPEPEPAAMGVPRHTAESVARSDSGRLFNVRAMTAHPAFAITETNAPAVATICRRLGGIPLAIELAAARARVLTPEQIAARLDERFRLLTGGDPDALPRQQTLRAALDWSYDLLSGPERRLLERLSVFDGGCEIEAAEVVCGGGEVVPEHLFDLMTSLVEKSLVLVEYHGDAARYRLQETVRAYADEKLNALASSSDDAGGAGCARDRHATLYLGLAQRADARLHQEDSGQWLAWLLREHDNLRAALGWYARGQPALGLRLATVLAAFWLLRGHLTTGASWLERMLEATPEADPADRATALVAAGRIEEARSEFTSGVALAEQALALFHGCGDAAGAADALHLLGVLAFRQSRFADSDVCFAHALTAARASENRRLVTRCLQALGASAMGKNRYDQARPLMEDALREWRALGDRRAAAVVLGSLAHMARWSGEIGRARALHEEALVICKGLGDRRETAVVLGSLAEIVAIEGDLVTAGLYAEEMLAIAGEIGDRARLASAHDRLTILARLRGDLVAAQAHAAANLEISSALGDPKRAHSALWEYAALEHDLRRPARAARILAAAMAVRAATGQPLPHELESDLRRYREEWRAALGEQALADAWADGESFSVDRAVTYALAAPSIADEGPAGAWS